MQGPLKGLKINLRGCEIINGVEKEKKQKQSLNTQFYFQIYILYFWLIVCFIVSVKHFLS